MQECCLCSLFCRQTCSPKEVTKHIRLLRSGSWYIVILLAVRWGRRGLLVAPIEVVSSYTPRGVGSSLLTKQLLQADR